MWPPQETSTFIINVVADQSAEKKMRRYISAALPVIEYIDKLYLSRNIILDWWLHICGKQNQNKKKKNAGISCSVNEEVCHDSCILMFEDRVEEIRRAPLKHLSFKTIAISSSPFFSFFTINAFSYSNYTIVSFVVVVCKHIKDRTIF